MSGLVTQQTGFPFPVIGNTGDAWTGTLWVDLDLPDTNPNPRISWFFGGAYGTFTFGTHTLDFASATDSGVTIFDYSPAIANASDDVILFWEPPLALENRI